MSFLPPPNPNTQSQVFTCIFKGSARAGGSRPSTRDHDLGRGARGRNPRLKVAQPDCDRGLMLWTSNRKHLPTCTKALRNHTNKRSAFHPVWDRHLSHLSPRVSNSCPFSFFSSYHITPSGPPFALCGMSRPASRCLPSPQPAQLPGPRPHFRYRPTAWAQSPPASLWLGECSPNPKREKRKPSSSSLG